MASEVSVSPDALRDDLEGVFERLAAVGDLVWVAAGKQRFLLVNEPEAVAEVLVRKADVLVKPRSQAIDTAPVRPELVDATIDIGALRLAATTGLAPREETVAAIARAAAETETAGWGAQVELMPALRRIAIRLAVEGAFASSLGASAESRLHEVLRWMDDAPRVLPPSRLSRHALRRGQMHQYLADIGAQLVANAGHGELTALGAVPEQARLALAGELLLGAVGPLVQTAGWLVVRFAEEADEAARLRSEWPATERTAAFVREVTRLHPTNPRITRAALAATTVAGEPVPAHTRVVLNVNAISRDARFYDEPERLLPDRWLDGRPHKFAYLSFGVGERRCLGEAFALTALTALLPALAGGRSFAFPPLQATSRGRRQLAEGLRVGVSAC